MSDYDDMTSVDPHMPVVVIGSGPAGAAAAYALSNVGCSVTVLDAGDTIEAGSMALFDALAQSGPEHWRPELAQRARNAFPVNVKHIPLKPAYGSLFPYAIDDIDLTVISEGSETLPSLAYGGLSNSWGASMLPYRQRDIEDWPISLEELEPHYRAVLNAVPIAAERDELSEVLPLYTDSPGKLRRNSQAEMLVDQLRRHTAALKAAGYSFGASRLAVATSMADPRRCRYSGICLCGCPYRSIYNASQTFEALIRDRGLDYRGGIYVDRLAEVNGSVTIEFHERRRPSATGRLTAARVFVACGAISSTRLVLDSLGCTQLTRRLQDSQYFIVPMLTSRAAPVSVATQDVTLAQVFLEIEGRSRSEHTTHLQLYGYNNIMLSALAKWLPFSPAGLERALQPVLGRLIVIQGYLHSSESPGLTIYRDVEGVHLIGDEVAAGADRVKQLVRRLMADRHLLGMFPIPGLLQVGRPGKGNHLGGSLPMRRKPAELETDTLGRLPNWSRVHIVDASIFPSVPATTVTFSVMANAHRIATTVAKL